MIRPELNESFKALEKAEDAIENAEYNLKGGFISATANRAYYGCYYCMIALLYTKSVHTKTHQGAHAKFSELFVKTGIFPSETSSDISVIFDFRQEADYDLDTDITHEEANDLIRRARSFYQLAKTYLQEVVHVSK
jgi:uncharacterized protein (UPF0332 family)